MHVSYAVKTIQSSNALKPSNLLGKLAYTPINRQKLSDHLKNYPNRKVAQELETGFKCGFKLMYSGIRQYRDCQNLKSAVERPEILQEKIDKEISQGRVAGPFKHLPMPNLQISPLGLVPKKDGDFRLIHHLSYPQDQSINSGIEDKHCTVHYSSIDDAVRLVNGLGPGSFLAKSDLKSAFRLLPIHPSDFELLGFMVGNNYYFDKCLPFGSSISCALFEKFATFLEWLVKKHSKNFAVMHYLDDFLFIGRATSTNCQHSLNCFRALCATLGVPIAEDKTVGPTKCLTFLGIELDTEAMVLRLPEEKIVELKSLIKTILQKPKVTLRELQSLIGSLNFACRAISPGRAFSRRLINATCHVSKPNHRIRVNCEMKQDLLVWLEFLDHYNGITAMQDQNWQSNEQLEFYTDSAGGRGKGFGIYFQGEWAHAQWPIQWIEEGLLSDITYLELFPVLVALMIWGDRLRNQRILFHIDNQAVVTIMNKKSSKSPRVMHLLRKLVLLTLKYNILIRGKHIFGRTNLIADAISRSQWVTFRTLAPQANHLPVPIPDQVWKI